MTKTTTAPAAFTIVTLERRTRRGMMASLYLAPGVQDGTPDTSGIFVQIEIGQAITTTLDLSKMDGEDGWVVDAQWTGSYPVFSNGFGARYLMVKKADDTLAAALDAAAAELAR